MKVSRIFALATIGCMVFSSGNIIQAAELANNTTYTISGYLSAGEGSNSSQSSALKEDIVVEITGIGDTKTGTNGFFKIEYVPEGIDYSIKIKKEGYLKREVSLVKLTSNIQIGTEKSPVLIWAGDLNQDGAINFSDVMLIAKSFNSVKTGSNFNEVCDLNKDGTINMADIVTIAKEFSKTTSDYTKVEISKPDTPIPTESPYAGWDSERSSYATYTGSGYSGGCSLLDPIPSDMEITALNPADYNFGGVNAALAGAYLEVSGSKGSTVVYVTDLYPEGAPGACDLCPTSFGKIGNMLDGKIDIKWHVVKAPITGNFSYRIKEGSNPNWVAIQVRNHILPVMKMEYYKNGSWINMEKRLWNHFETSGMGTTTLKIRITDIRGFTVEDTIEGIPDDGAQPAFIIPGKVQFPD